MSQEIIAHLSCDRCVKITENVFVSICQFIQDDTSKFEAGGVLIGRILNENSHLIIEHNTSPLHGDTRKRSGFKRSAKNHQKKIDRFWLESNKTQTYLGEWHTHPEGNPTPSSTDIKDWERRVIRDKFFNDVLIMAIVGTSHIGIWSINKKKTITKISEYEY